MGICDNRTVIITGAARGLGRAYALGFAAQGANVVVNDIGTSLGGEGRDTSAADEVVARIEALLGLDAADTLRYADRKKGQRRAMRLARNGEQARLEAFILAGDTSAQAWVKTLLQEELPAQAYGRLLLVPGAKAPVAVQSRGKQVCTCFNVTAPAIDGYLAGCSGTEDERLASLQSALKCGTNCGSCLPELKRMVRAVAPLKQAA